jgi:hypothetical protein
MAVFFQRHAFQPWRRPDSSPAVRVGRGDERAIVERWNDTVGRMTTFGISAISPFASDRKWLLISSVGFTAANTS